LAFNPQGTLAVAFEAESNASCAAPKAARATLLRPLLLVLSIGKLLLASSRCGELART